jgi:hypothetical protein
LEQLKTLEMVGTRIYGKFVKTFILVVADGLEASDTSFVFAVIFIHNMCN